MARALLGRIYGWALLVGFLAAIGVVPVVTLLARSDTLRLEKRAPAPMPALPRTAADGETWPARFESFFADTFGLRDALLRLDSLIVTSLLGRSPSDRVLDGRDGWLFYTGDRLLEIHRGDRRLGEGETARWRRELERRRDLLAARGIAYLFVVAPDKASIYPEMMPAHLMRGGRSKLIDQMLDLAREARLPVLDLRPALEAAKGEGHRVYYPHDTHWNAWGAAVGAREITRAIAGEIAVPGLAPRRGRVAEFSDEPPFEEERHTGDLATMARREVVDVEIAPRRSGSACRPAIERASETAAGPRPTRATCAGETRSLLVFHDSFGAALVEPLAGAFGRSVFDWRYPEFDEFRNVVDQTRPDVVVELRVERKLLDPPSGLVDREGE